MLSCASEGNPSHRYRNGSNPSELGYRGPGIGKALRALLDAVVKERVPNEREALLELLRHDVMPWLDGPAS